MFISSLIVSMFTIVELNCENLFDWYNDTLKDDTEWLPSSPRHWTKSRFYKKIDTIGRTIIDCGKMDNGDWALPDIVALTEVENDTAMTYLTRRSLLRNAEYKYIMTNSKDERGIDVVLMYSPMTFKPISQNTYTLPAEKLRKPTRDILYVKGLTMQDTLHVFVIHAPSRRGGEKSSRPYRRCVIDKLCSITDSILATNEDAQIIITGDFNDYTGNENLEILRGHQLQEIIPEKGRNGAKGTYKYKGLWGSLDHFFVTDGVAQNVNKCYINDADFLLIEDKTYGGKQPRRNYIGMRWQNGYSDHLPLVLRLKWGK